MKFNLHIQPLGDVLQNSWTVAKQKTIQNYWLKTLLRLNFLTGIFINVDYRETFILCKRAILRNLSFYRTPSVAVSVWSHCELAYRVWLLACITYICTPTFIGIFMILDMRLLTRMLFFPYNFLRFSKICYYIFDPWFICLSLQWDSLLFTLVLKKTSFSIFNTNYFINICHYLRALSNLESQ